MWAFFAVLITALFTVSFTALTVGHSQGSSVEGAAAYGKPTPLKQNRDGSGWKWRKRKSMGRIL